MISPEQCRAARALLNWSQDDLATKANIARQTVVDFERGVRTPNEASIEAIQSAFGLYRVEFQHSTGREPMVALRNSIWKLTPIDTEAENWFASIYRGEVIIRAPSERRAREIASLAYGIARPRLPNGRIAINPWTRIVGDAACERLENSAHDHNGPEAILDPAEHDPQWKQYS